MKTLSRKVLFLVKSMQVLLILALLFGGFQLKARPALAACSDGNMFATVRSSAPNIGEIWRWNQASSSWSLVISSTIQFDAIARDPSNCNLLYLVSNNLNTNAADRHDLYRLNTTGPTLTYVGETGIAIAPDNADRLAFAPNGTLYALVGATLYTINTTTGAATSVGVVGGTWPGVGAGGDLTFTTDGTAFYAVRSNVIYSVPLSTLTAATLCTLTSGHFFTGVGLQTSSTLVVTDWNAAPPTASQLSSITVNPLSCASYPNSTSPYPFATGSQQTSDLTDNATGGTTDISLASFASAWNYRTVRLAWETTVEVDLLGYNVFRATSPEGERLKLNPALILPEGQGLEGASYAYADESAQSGETYYYFLEALDSNGAYTYGPVVITVAPYAFFAPIISR